MRDSRRIHHLEALKHEPRRYGIRPPDALTGYRILDFGTAFASPMAAHLLADMGAEVIKIESHTRLDGLRLGRPIVGEDIAGGDREWPEYQPVFHGLNRSKLGITVNIKHPEGVDCSNAWSVSATS